MVRSLIPTEGRLLRPFSRFEEEMENLMERFFARENGWPVIEGFAPTANLAETEGEFEVTVELPGLKPEEVTVEMKNGELWISGEKREEKEEEGKTWHRVERRMGSFRRVFRLPTPIKEEAIEAKFENGVLKVTVPKTEEVKPKRIEVKA
jgi:HSP20 family protein